MWKTYRTDSSSDQGTLAQMLTLIKRTPAANNPKKDTNACSDALFTVLKGHILAYACKELDIESLDSTIVNPALTSASDADKQKFIVGLSMKIVENCSVIGDALLAKKVSESGDHKYNYARTLCHYASLALEFYDAWHEGDGVRIIPCYHLLLPHVSIWSNQIFFGDHEASNTTSMLASKPNTAIDLGSFYQHPRWHGTQHPMRPSQ